MFAIAFRNDFFKIIISYCQNTVKNFQISLQLVLVLHIVTFISFIIITETNYFSIA